MHERQTPTNLLDGRPWVGWGLSVELGHTTDRAVQLIAQRSGRAVEEVAALLVASEDRRRYLLLEALAINENTAVYAGVDRLLARDVAVKIHRDQRKHASQRALFESQAMARLEHPNIVRIYDMGEHVHVGGAGDQGEQTAWMYSVIELCDADLGSWCEGLEWFAIVGHVLEAARGLAHLHEIGFVHGDIKPANILMRDGVAKLADFGHAKKVGVLSLEHGGTMGYIAPEVVTQGPGYASDVFALATTLWVCLFGVLPYPAPPGDVSRRTACAAMMDRTLAHAIEPPSSVPPGMPGSVLLMLQWSLHPLPELRPPLPTLINRLSAAVDREARRKRLRRRVPAVAAVLSVAVGLGFVIGTRSAGEGEGVLFEVALRMVDPLTRAELAAQAGRVDVVVAELNRLDARVRTMSSSELDEVVARTTRIAEVLEPTWPDHAAIVRVFATRFRRMQQGD
jgi:serine/threonine protein kinase